MPPKRRQSSAGNTSRENLGKVLSQTEINAIKNNGTLNKLEQALRNESMDEIKIQRQKLEADLDESRQEFEVAKKSHDDVLQQQAEKQEVLEKENSAMKIEIDNLRLQVAQVNSSSLNKDGDVNQLKVEKERINAEKGGLDMILKQKTAEIESLTTSYEELTDKIKNLTHERNNYKIKLDDLEADKATQEIGKNRMRNQVNVLREENERIVSAGDKQDKVIRDLKAQLSNEQRKKSFDLEELRKDNIALQKRIDMLDNDLEEKSNQVLQVTCETEEKTKEFADIEQDLRNEIGIQGRLIELLNQQLDTHRTQTDEWKNQLSTARSKMEALVVENAEIKSKLERYEKIVADVELEKKKMTIELKNANELLNSIKTKGPTLSKEELENFSPTAAAAVKLIRSGMTLTEMYSEYIDKSNEAERLTAENERLNECMDALTSEIRSKVPILEKQRRDYENAAHLQNELSDQLDETIGELQVAKKELFHANQSRSRLARENDAFQNQITTLNKQIAILLTNDDIKSLTKQEADKFYTKTHQMQDVITKYQAENKVLVERVEILTAEGKEDFEARLKEMSHLLELEKLERGNIDAELQSIKEQRKTWQSYFDRQKEEEDEEEETIMGEVSFQGSTAERKSPRKSISQAEQKSTIKLGLVEQQLTEERERHEEERDQLKEEINDLRKEMNSTECDNMKMASEMKTLDMNVTMKEESLKRVKAELELLNDKNQRLWETMQLEAKNTSKITEEYVSLREENVKLQIALESSKKRSAMHEDELKRIKADEEFKNRHESGQALILDTIQQLQQQMTEKQLQENVQIKSELESAKRESDLAKTQFEEIKKEIEEKSGKYNQQIDLLNKQLEEERNKNQTVQTELQRVKSRQLLGFNSADGKPTSPGRAGPIATLEMKQLTDEIRQLKSEIKTLETQREEFKKISLDAEKRMNQAGEEYTKTNLIRDKEVEKLKSQLTSKVEVISKLEVDISELKSNCGQEDINQLRVKCEGAERELEGVKFQLSERDAELSKAKSQYTEQLIQHGKAQEATQKLRIENSDMKIKVNELVQSCDVQKARNDSMTKDWEEEKDTMHKANEEMKGRLEQQSKQNKLLHDQLQTLNDQVRSSRRRASMAADLDTSVNDSLSEDHASLLELTSILRRNEEIAESARDLEHAENIRLKQRIKNLEKQLEDSNNILSEMESLKSKPQITSEQHQQLMEQVNQMNILRESNSVLRDEKQRAQDDKDSANKRIKELELEIEPLRRKENEFSEQLKIKDAEKKEIEGQIAKMESQHAEQIKKISASRVAADQVKKIVALRDEYKKKFDEKSAEFRAKENELNEYKQKDFKSQQQIQSLESEKTNLTKSKADTAEKDKENKEILAKLRKEISDEKSKCDRIRQIAKKYKETDATKGKKIAELLAGATNAAKDTTTAEIQTDPTANVASEKQEVEMMKKMLQNQINKLKEEMSKKETELTSKESELQEERKKKEKILVNAKRKIHKLTSDLNESRKNAGKTSEESNTRSLPEGTSADTTKDIAEIKPHVREPPAAKAAKVVTVAPTRLPAPPVLTVAPTMLPAPSATEEAPSTPVTATVAPQPSPSSPASTSNAPLAVQPLGGTLVQSIPSTSTTAQLPVQQEDPPTTTSPADPVIDPPAEAELDVPDENDEQVLEEPVVSSSVVSTSGPISVDSPAQNDTESDNITPPVSSSSQQFPASTQHEPTPGPSSENTLKRSRSPEPDSQDDTVTDAKKSKQDASDEQESQVIEEDLDEPIAVPIQEENPRSSDVLPSEEDDLNDEPQIQISAEVDEDEIEPPLPDSSVQSRPPAINVPQRNIPRSPLNVPTTPSLISNVHGENDDGCVPRTPTLTTGAGVRPHPGDQALVSPQVPAGQPPNRFTFFGTESEQVSSGFGSSTFGSSAFGGSAFGSSSGFGSSSTSTFGTTSGGFGALAQSSTEPDHSVPGAPDAVSSTTEGNAANSENST